MGFGPGNKMGAGRPKGSVNNRTRHFREVLEERGFDIAEAFLDIRDEAAKFFLENRTDPIGGPQALKILLDVTNDIASYALPKLKSIELHSNPLDGLSNQDKLEALRDAVAILEDQVSKEAVQIGDSNGAG